MAGPLLACVAVSSASAGVASKPSSNANESRAIIDRSVMPNKRGEALAPQDDVIITVRRIPARKVRRDLMADQRPALHMGPHGGHGRARRLIVGGGRLSALSRHQMIARHRHGGGPQGLEGMARAPRRRHA